MRGGVRHADRSHRDGERDRRELRVVRGRRHFRRVQRLHIRAAQFLPRRGVQRRRTAAGDAPRRRRRHLRRQRTCGRHVLPPWHHLQPADRARRTPVRRRAVSAAVRRHHRHAGAGGGHGRDARHQLHGRRDRSRVGHRAVRGDQPGRRRCHRAADDTDWQNRKDRHDQRGGLLSHVRHPGRRVSRHEREHRGADRSGVSEHRLQCLRCRRGRADRGHCRDGNDGCRLHAPLRRNGLWTSHRAWQGRCRT